MIREQQELIQSLIRQIEICQQNKILLGKPLLQMRAEFGYSGTIYEYLDSLEPGQIPDEVTAKLYWWKEHLNFLLRIALGKREKRRKHLERISAANKEGYLRIDFPYDYGEK
jgi:hypothetical protein